jgi:NAD(P)-dependent dehydrogenase (short-subunit alcohol dehydrogenase family)
MSDRTNVVLGAASGMGAAVCELLPQPLLRADLRPGDDGIACDVTSEADVARLVEATGTLGALVLTAGLSPAMAPGRTIWEVNLRGTARVLRLVEPILAEGSAAVCFASMAGHLFPPNPEWNAVLDEPESPTFFADLAAAGIDPDQPQLAYALSKQAVIRLVRRRSRAWGRKGARLLSLSPGIIDTGMGRLEAEHEPAMADMVRGSALGRMARPEEVAAVAAFLVSDQASFLTGTDVLVDGGAVAAMP